jgi:peptidase E
LDKYLEELLDQGKIYLGISAGSILAVRALPLLAGKSDWIKTSPVYGI